MEKPAIVEKITSAVAKAATSPTTKLTLTVGAMVAVTGAAIIATNVVLNAIKSDTEEA